MTSLLEDWIDSLPEKTMLAIHEGLCAQVASAPCKPRLNADSTNTEYGVSLLAEEGKLMFI